MKIAIQASSEKGKIVG